MSTKDTDTRRLSPQTDKQVPIWGKLATRHYRAFESAGAPQDLPWIH